MNIDNKQRTQLAVALGAVVLLVAGYSAFGKSTTSEAVGAGGGKAMQGPPGGGFGGGPGGPGGGPGGPGGYGRPGGSSGPTGAQGKRGMREKPKQVTGDAATKAKAAAEKEVDGTAKGVIEHPKGDGYLVFVKTDDGPVIVELSKSFEVTGTRTPPERGNGRGGPPGGGPPGGGPSGGQMPGGNTQ